MRKMSIANEDVGEDCGGGGDDDDDGDNEIIIMIHKA